MHDSSSNVTVEDLGQITEPVLVFGGPYSNLQATQALLETANDAGIPSNRLICTGDVIAYCANPIETVAAIRASGAHVVMGNCEESLGFQLDDCGCGFEEGTDCDILSRQWYAYSDQLLSDDDRTWLRTRPRRMTATIGDRHFAFIHGSATDISGWVFESTNIGKKATDVAELSCDAVVAGHCGLPFIQPLPNNKLWINAGVIGMPANDGTRHGWYALISPSETEICIDIKPLTFDTASAVQAMQAAKLMDAYVTSLQTGLWPNMDVLPGPERSRQGIERQPIRHVWPHASKNAA